MILFEVIDKTGRKIRLTDKQWNHIQHDHPDVMEEDIRISLTNPVKTTIADENKSYYYHYFKNKDGSAKYLRAIIKYINNEGFVITAYFVKNI